MFRLFGPDHIAVLVILVASAAALLVLGRRLSGSADRGLRCGLAAILVGNEAIAYAAALANGVVRVPLQLCDVAFFVTIWALVTMKSVVSEVAYFWGLAGSLQAVLTPDLQEAFPSYWWLKFFLSHCGIVLGVVLLAARGCVQPTARSVWRMWLLTNGYVLVAGIVNWLFGTNYGYLARKPMQPSLLDHFGPWPYYILGMELVALVSFYLYYAPFAVARWARRRAA